MVGRRTPLSTYPSSHLHVSRKITPGHKTGGADPKITREALRLVGGRSWAGADWPRVGAQWPTYLWLRERCNISFSGRSIGPPDLCSPLPIFSLSLDRWQIGRMEIFNTSESEFQELGVRVSRMRVSLRMKKRRNGSSSSEVSTQDQPPAAQPDTTSRLRVPVGPSSNTSTASNTSFRSRLSSHSSVCSTDSGFVSNPSRSRVGSTSSSSRRQPGSILTKIAQKSGEEATKNADSEFSMFYRPVNRSSSSVSSISTSSRNRSVSVSSTCDYSDIYSTIEELCDPFDEPAPPLPPRKARLRPPMLPPYPSSAVTLVNKVSETILCWTLGEHVLNTKISISVTSTLA